MCGYQQQVTTEHWNLSSALLIKKCADDRKQVLVLKKKEDMQIAIIFTRDQMKM